jgi:hypothetical protein
MFEKVAGKYHVKTAGRHAPRLGAVLLDNRHLFAGKLVSIGIQVHAEFALALYLVDKFTVPAS